MKNILIFILLLVTASAGGWLFISQTGMLPKSSNSITSDTINSPSSQVTECENIANKVDRKKCFVNECEKKKDNKTDFQYNLCIYNLISDKKLDIETDCNLINDIHDKNNCFEDFAVIKKNEYICDNILDINDKESCYRTVAYKTKDTTICNKISDEFSKNACLRDAK